MKIWTQICLQKIFATLNTITLVRMFENGSRNLTFPRLRIRRGHIKTKDETDSSTETCGETPSPARPGFIWRSPGPFPIDFNYLGAFFTLYSHLTLQYALHPSCNFHGIFPDERCLFFDIVRYLRILHLELMNDSSFWRRYVGLPQVPAIYSPRAGQARTFEQMIIFKLRDLRKIKCVFCFISLFSISFYSLFSILLKPIEIYGIIFLSYVIETVRSCRWGLQRHRPLRWRSSISSSSWWCSLKTSRQPIDAEFSSPLQGERIATKLREIERPPTMLSQE